MHVKKIKTVKSMNEDETQAFICSWCLQNCLIPVAVPNGFNLGGLSKMLRAYGASEKELKTQNAKQIMLLKQEGLHTGFPDMMVFGMRDGAGSVLFMENKVKSNKASPIQIACHDWLKALGFIVEVSKSSVDAISKIKYYFGTSGQYLNSSYIDNRRRIIAEVKEKHEQTKK